MEWPFFADTYYDVDFKGKCKLKTDNVEKCAVLCKVTNVSDIALFQCESIRETVLLNVTHRNRTRKT